MSKFKFNLESPWIWGSFVATTALLIGLTAYSFTAAKEPTTPKPHTRFVNRDMKIYEQVDKQKPLLLPIRKGTLTDIVGTPRYDKYRVFSHKHEGLDLGRAEEFMWRDSIFAVADGKILLRGNANTIEKQLRNKVNAGTYLVQQAIVEQDTFKIKYLHLRKRGIQVRSGSKVKKGQFIAYMGDTGNVDFHLHVEVYKKEKGEYVLVDPRKYFSGMNTSMGAGTEVTQKPLQQKKRITSFEKTSSDLVTAIMESGNLVYVDSTTRFTDLEIKDLNPITALQAFNSYAFIGSKANAQVQTTDTKTTVDETQLAESTRYNLFDLHGTRIPETYIEHELEEQARAENKIFVLNEKSTLIEHYLSNLEFVEEELLAAVKTKQYSQPIGPELPSYEPIKIDEVASEEELIVQPDKEYVQEYFVQVLADKVSRSNEYLHQKFGLPDTIIFSRFQKGEYVAHIISKPFQEEFKANELRDLIVSNTASPSAGVVEFRDYTYHKNKVFVEKKDIK